MIGYWFVFDLHRGGRQFDVDASEQSMGSQLTVLTEAEAAALVAKQPDAISSSSLINAGSMSSSLIDTSSSPLQLQMPPFRLKGINKSQ